MVVSVLTWMMARQLNNMSSFVQKVSRETVFVFQSLETIHPGVGMMPFQKGPPAFPLLIVTSGPRDVTITDEATIHRKNLCTCSRRCPCPPLNL